MKQLSFAVVAFLIGWSAQAQHTVASGGDYIRRIFEQGRTTALSKIEKINACSFEDSQATPEVQKWILDNKKSLQQDVELSKHNWVIYKQPTCAYTEHSPNAPIYLSYPTCDKATAAVIPAAFTLIHESAHHLAVADESLADQIAQAVMDAKVVENCIKGEAEAVFKPEICHGPRITAPDVARYFKPGEKQAKAGNYKFYARSRFCYTLSGCTDWTDNNVLLSFDEYEGSIHNLSEKLQPMIIESSTWAPKFRITFFNQFNYPDEHINMVYQEDNKLVLDYGQKITIYLEKNLSNRPRQKRIVIKDELELNGSINKSCGWFKSSLRIPIQQLADVSTVEDGYQENEIIYYGTH